MSYLDERKIVTREKRLSTLSHFNGTLEQLKNEAGGSEIKQRIRTFSQINEDEIVAAIRAVSTIEQAAVIVHGVAGCAASNLFFNAEKAANIYSTNLQEKDTILGSDARLHKAISKIVEEVNPKVIFIVGTPVIAINNDDVNSVIFELEDEFNIKLVFIYSDGFKTKSALTAYDIVSHSILKKITEKSDEKNKNLLNIISFSESKESVRSVASLIEELGIETNILPRFGSVDSIKKAGSAQASVVLSQDEGGYLAEELRDGFDVAYIKTDAPIGLQGTNAFLRNIAKVFGKEAEAEKIIQEKEAGFQKAISEQILAGKKIYFDGKLSDVTRFFTLFNRLGGEIAGFSVQTIDLENRAFLQRLDSIPSLTPVIVGNGQYFEKANAIAKLTPDYYISQNGAVSFAAEVGAIPVSLKTVQIFGYSGITHIIDALKTAAVFGKNRASLYKDAWLKKSGSWYVKQETK
ncbi:MAG: nitrogenase component 1 [Treponema sp.]|nr:nitrogenase component 1 [Treponema sp.]